MQYIGRPLIWCKRLGDLWEDAFLSIFKQHILYVGKLLIRLHHDHFAIVLSSAVHNVLFVQYPKPEIQKPLSHGIEMIVLALFPIFFLDENFKSCLAFVFRH